MKRLIAAALACALALTGCGGGTVELSDEASDLTIFDGGEITFEVAFCMPDAVTYTVCSEKENFLFYEGHQFACVEKKADDGWYPLVRQTQVSTGDFQWVSIPAQERQEIISIRQEYGGRLEKGTYRLVAACSLSAELPDDCAEQPDQSVYLAAEFEID